MVNSNGLANLFHNNGIRSYTKNNLSYSEEKGWNFKQQVIRFKDYEQNTQPPAQTVVRNNLNGQESIFTYNNQSNQNAGANNQTIWQNNTQPAATQQTNQPAAPPQPQANNNTQPQANVQQEPPVVQTPPPAPKVPTTPAEKIGAAKDIFKDFGGENSKFADLIKYIIADFRLDKDPNNDTALASSGLNENREPSIFFNEPRIKDFTPEEIAGLISHEMEHSKDFSNGTDYIGSGNWTSIKEEQDASVESYNLVHKLADNNVGGLKQGQQIPNDFQDGWGKLYNMPMNQFLETVANLYSELPQYSRGHGIQA